MERAANLVGELIAAGGALAGVVIGLFGHHLIGTWQRRAEAQQVRVEALQEAAQEYAAAVQGLEVLRDAQARHEANPPPSAVPVVPGEPDPGPWPFDHAAQWKRYGEVVEAMGEAGSRLRRVGPRARDAELRRLAAELRDAGSGVFVRSVEADVWRRARWRIGWARCCAGCSTGGNERGMGQRLGQYGRGARSCHGRRIRRGNGNAHPCRGTGRRPRASAAGCQRGCTAPGATTGA